MLRAHNRATSIGMRLSEALMRKFLQKKITKSQYIMERLRLEAKVKSLTEGSVRQIKRLNERDPFLTMLYNRSKFESLARAAFEKSKKQSYVLIDIDKFKNLNDTLGHDAGDIAIRFFASHLNALAHEKKWNGFAGRGGSGDEFEVVLPFSPSRAAAFFRQLERRLVQHFSNRFEPAVVSALQGKLFTLSVGVAGFEEGKEIGEVRKLADKRLYQSKEMGRNRVTFSGKKGTFVIRRERK